MEISPRRMSSPEIIGALEGASSQLRRADQRRFKISRPDQVPAGALRWSNNKQKGSLRRHWRLGIMARYSKDGRSQLVVGWALWELSATFGYAIAGDAHLANETKLPLKVVQTALTRLERNGAIIRVHVEERGRLRRRIYLAHAILNHQYDTPRHEGYEVPPTTGGADTPCHRRTEKRERHLRRRKGRPTVSEAAQLEAERREKVRRGEPIRNWLEDDE